MSAERPLPEDESPRRRRPWDLLTAAVLLFLVASEVRFVLLDGRYPWDVHFVHDALPEYVALLGREDALHQALARLGSETTAWYEFLLALGIRIAGRGPLPFDVPEVLWILGVYALVTALARRLHGPAAGLLALLVLTFNAQISALGRMGWIHIPELFLVLAAAALLLRDPALRRPWTLPLLLVSIFAGVSLRPSCALWMATLAPLLVPGWWAAPRRSTFALRVGALAGLAAAALLPLLPAFRAYAQSKVQARTRYAWFGEPGALLGEITGAIHPVMLALFLLGAVGVVARGSIRRHRAFWGMVALWLVVPPALFAGFRAGLANFPVFLVAIAWVAAAGTAGHARPVAAVLLGLWIPFHLSTWMPTSLAQGIFRFVPLPPIELAEHPGNYKRLFSRLHGEEVAALLDATCPSGDTPCTVMLDHGLLQPEGDGPGWLELYLLDRDGVHLEPAWFLRDAAHARRPHALVRYRCRRSEPHWHARHPDLEGKVGAIIANHGLKSAWQRDLGHGCSYTWLTPGGTLAHPDRAPDP